MTPAPKQKPAKMEILTIEEVKRRLKRRRRPVVTLLDKEADDWLDRWGL